MPAIVTLTLAPSLDKSTTTAKLLPDHKLRCAAPEYAPGGGGINVSRGLKQLRTSSLAVYAAGGRPGEHFAELMDSAGIEHMPVRVKSDLRVNFIVTENTSNKEYRFGMPAPELLEREEQRLINVLRKLKMDYLVISGSMPPGASDDFIARVARITKGETRIVVDTSGDALREAVDEGIFLLKPNLNELAALVGEKTLSQSDVKEAGMKLIHAGACELIVVSLGADGAWYGSKDGFRRIKTSKVEKRSTVGAGDSMVAGMVYRLSKKAGYRDAVAFGAACGSAATMNGGPELFLKQDVDRLYKEINTLN